MSSIRCSNTSPSFNVVSCELPQLGHASGASRVLGRQREIAHSREDVVDFLQLLVMRETGEKMNSDFGG